MKRLLPMLLLVSLPALAQMTPVGLWKTIDDNTGKEKGLVRIVADARGVLSGRVEKNLDPADKPDAVCEECTDERKGKPVIGMTIIRNVRPSTSEAGLWDGGDILDPDDGKVYRVLLRPVKEGRQLEVRGYIGFALLGRTQVWHRAE